MRIFIALAFIVLACMADDKFKETEKHKEVDPGTPPTIKIPENLRMKVQLTTSFNVGFGIDIVRKYGVKFV